MRRSILLAAKLYPWAWRERYGEEFQALLEDVNPGWRELADVLGGAVKMQITHGTTPLKLIAALAVAGMIVATAASFAVPRQYVSSAAVRIAAKVDDPQRLDGIRTNVLSRRNLASLITGSLDLYSEDRRLGPLEDAIEQMHRDVRIDYTQAPSQDGAPTPALNISFSYPDKRKAQAVVRELAGQIVGANTVLNRDREADWRRLWPADPPPPGLGIDTPSIAALPQKPIGPNRFEFAAWGLSSGLALGLLGALVMRWPQATVRMAAFATTGGALAFGLSLLIPDTYTSTAIVRFVPPSMVPQRLVPAVSGGQPEKRFQSLTQKACGTYNLEGIIRSLNLYPEQRVWRPLGEVVGVMLRNISFRPLNSGHPGDPGEFEISFSYPERLKAQAVVARMAMELKALHTNEIRDWIEWTGNVEIRHLVDQATEEGRTFPYTLDPTAKFAVVSSEAPDHSAVRNLIDRRILEQLEVSNAGSLPQTPATPNRPAIAAAGLFLGLLLGAFAPRLRRLNTTPQPA